jgi:hypothetical protein
MFRQTVMLLHLNHQNRLLDQKQDLHHHFYLRLRHHQ